MTVKDGYGRPILNFRIMITDSCNLECFYCHKEGQYLAHNLMTPEEIRKISNIAGKFGVKNIKITGGEPLLRADLEEIISNLSDIGKFKEISMVTNGRILSISKAEKLKKAGLKRVNISLPTLEPTKYMKMTGGSIDDTINGVKNAVEMKLNPVKLNMVLMKGLNDMEVEPAIKFAGEVGAVLQLIELEPINMSEETYHSYHMSLDEVEAKLQDYAKAVNVRCRMQARKVYSLPEVDVELVKPIENTSFCAHCTRIRVTSDGKLKPCLMRNDNLVDILTPIRNNVSNKELEKIFMKAIALREPYWKG